ncbi:zinc-ribbon domain-containing protein [Thioclava sp. GXIMD4215]|uniref:zinc-ribbon domain-containing protein n=1 Tax=Thioclava sp. GXIMD4215 TaxID=3131928 RepID=UPI0032567B2C
MRLTCPKCAAQYEVNDSVIPDAGRDVQCANCGTMWFQPSARMQALPDAVTDPREEPAEEPAPSAWKPGHAITSLADADRAQDLHDAAIAADIARALESDKEPLETEGSAVADAAADEISDNSESSEIPEKTASGEASPDKPREEEPPQEDEAEDLRPAPQPGMMPRRKLDDGLLAILREEAEREAQARRAEGSLLQTQEEMNLEPVAQAAASRVQAKLALLRQNEQSAPATSEVAEVALPDAGITDADITEAALPSEEAPVLAAYAPPQPDDGFEEDDPDYHIGAVLPEADQFSDAPEDSLPEPDAQAHVSISYTSDLPPAQGAAPVSKPEPQPESQPAPVAEEAPHVEAVELVHVEPDPASDPIHQISRRDQLPDIEEINSTLRASSDRGRHAAAYDAPQTLARRRSSFRLGFSLVVGLAAILLAIYLGASQIAAAVPAAQRPLQAYVTKVDQARLALDDQLEKLIIWLGGTA